MPSHPRPGAREEGSYIGYFPNGSEGDAYEARWCVRCAHYRDDGACCPVWMLHILHNYDQLKRESTRAALAMFIPYDEAGTGNGQCTMFIESDAVARMRCGCGHWRVQHYISGDAQCGAQGCTCAAFASVVPAPRFPHPDQASLFEEKAEDRRRNLRLEGEL